MRDATNVNVSYVDHTNSAFSLGGLDGSACGGSLASLIRNRIVEYEAPTLPQFSEEATPVQEVTSPPQEEK